MIDVEMLKPTADEMLSGLSTGEATRQKILFKASAVQQLSSVTGEMLGGLHATPALRHRILVKADRQHQARQATAARREPAPRKGFAARLTPAVGMALVLALMIGLGLNYGADSSLFTDPAPQYAATDLGSGMAGGGGGTGSVPQYRSLFEGEGANPPLIGVHGRYYRMLSVPVSSDVVGTPIAEVQDFTSEPSLAATVGVVSNVAKAGTQIYAVDGVSQKTACIAEVDGRLRLFQRVGYAANTFLGNEQFEDILDVSGRVAALELSGVGVITDERVANDLIYTLTEFAIYGGSDVPDSGQALTIYLTNGLSLQLTCQDDTLGGCGAWVCPEFFEAFEAELAGL